jgi:hypothetical protein
VGALPPLGLDSLVELEPGVQSRTGRGVATTGAAGVGCIGACGAGVGLDGGVTTTGAGFAGRLEPGVQEPDWAVVSPQRGRLAVVVLEPAVRESG